MGWLDWLFGTKKIKELEVYIYNLKEDLKLAKEEARVTGMILGKTLVTLKNVSDELKFLKEPNYADRPEWLEESNDIYKPSIKVAEKGSLYNINIGTKDIYSISPSLEKVVEDKGFRNLVNLDERLWNIWSYVTDRVTYAYDQDEGWEYPTTTYYRMKGDCEDSTILFVTLCRMSGIKPDSVFNVCGWWKMSDGSNVGHSFPIAKNSDGKWYVYETTLPSINASYKPKLFKGSNYTADWGISNWLYFGRIKNGNQI